MTNMNTLASHHDGEDEGVQRLTQYGIRLPDGTVVWAQAGAVDSRGKLSAQWLDLNGQTYWIDPSYDKQRNVGSYGTFWGLVENHAKRSSELGVPVSELVRVKREVVVVYGVATEDKAGGEFNV